jgi:hypothetical protein
MKKLFLFSVIALALSTVSCEKDQLKDLDGNPKFEELNNGNISAERDPEAGGIWTGDIRIPSHG